MSDETEKRLEVLYDHYKESAATYEKHINRRTIVTSAVLLVMALMILGLSFS